MADGAAERITGLLTAHGIAFRIHEHPVARTVEDARALLPFPPEQFLKTIAFRVKDGPWVLAAVRGEDRVDYRKLADALGVRRADLARPDATAIAAALGYVIGGIGPIAPNDDTRTIIDSGALVMERVYCGIGRDDQTLEIALADLITVTQALIAPIVQAAPSVA